MNKRKLSAIRREAALNRKTNGQRQKATQKCAYELRLSDPTKCVQPRTYKKRKNMNEQRDEWKSKCTNLKNELSIARHHAKKAREENDKATVRMMEMSQRLEEMQKQEKENGDTLKKMEKQHQQVIKNMRKQHQEVMKTMKKHHQDVIKDLRNRHREDMKEKDRKVKAMATKHRDEINEKENEMKAKLAAMTETRKQRMASILADSRIFNNLNRESGPEATKLRSNAKRRIKRSKRFIKRELVELGFCDSIDDDAIHVKDFIIKNSKTVRPPPA